MNKSLTISLLALGVFANAQWSKAVPNSEITKRSDNSVYYKLDIENIRGRLMMAEKTGKNANAVTIEIPTLDGGVERFAVNSFPVMDESLANRYQLGSYVGVGIDDPTKYIRFSVAPNDFQSMIISNGKYEFIEPATNNKEFYSVHSKTGKEGAFACTTKEDAESVKRLNDLVENGAAERAGNQKFHTLRLAISVTGEYTNYFGGVDGALAQINATMTRVNGVFEQEFNTHLNIIDAPELIFTNAATDPYSSWNQMCKWNYELMEVLHNGEYGVNDDDFDIGHLFGRSGGGGNAGCIGCIGSNDTSYSTYYDCGYSYKSPNNYKGSGITSPGVGAPSGDNFDIDYVAHEMGHQLGDSHTYSFYENYLNKEMEPGSGSTIMGYAGITGSTTDVQQHSDPYFHTASIEQVQQNLASKTVDVETDIDNNPPVVTPMTETYTIPKGTAFVLTAEATDPEDDNLTYCWEEVDASKLVNGVTKSNIGNTTSGATFRSWAPTTSPTRYFPKLETVLSGVLKNTKDFEAVSTVARTTNFRVTVRDNKGADSQTAYATQTVIVGSAPAFTVSEASGKAGSPLDLNWEVSGTTAAPYNVDNVKIDYTTDEGETWNTLLESTPNNGTASVTFPASLGESTVSVRVSAIGNIFFAVNKVDLEAADLATSESNGNTIQVYPNPVANVLYTKNAPAKSAYKIYNAAGQLVAKGIVSPEGIKVSSLSQGTYIISINNNGEEFKTKFIKN